MTKDNVKIAPKNSFTFKVCEGESYLWCSCGLSQSQPFCDGSHKGTGFKPILYKATSDKVVSFCGCKLTKNAPICDGSHSEK